MSKEAMKVALEALEGIHPGNMTPMAEEYWNKATTALREALAEQPAQQEPVAWMFEDDEDNGHKTFRQTPPSHEAVAYLAKWNRPAWVPLYTTPPQRKPLTDEEIEEICWTEVDQRLRSFARAIEAAHGIKENT